MFDVNELSRFFVKRPPAYCKMTMRRARVAVQASNPVQGSDFEFPSHLVHGISDSLTKSFLPFLIRFPGALERAPLRRDDNMNDILFSNSPLVGFRMLSASL